MHQTTQSTSIGVQTLPPPTVIAHDQIAQGEHYIIAVQPHGGVGELIGPFEVEGALLLITRHHPLNGHFVAKTLATDSDSGERVFIPRGGMTCICGITYSLHAAKKTHIDYFEALFRKSREMLATLRAQHGSDCKYLE